MFMTVIAINVESRNCEIGPLKMLCFTCVIKYRPDTCITYCFSTGHKNKKMARTSVYCYSEDNRA